MSEYCLTNRLYRRDWIFNSPIACVGFAFEDYLREHGYGEGSIHVYLASVAHFARWIRRRQAELPDIGSRLCEEFVESHLPRCRCPAPRQTEVTNIRPALKHLRAVLAEQGFIAVETQSRTPVTDEVAGFHHYLVTVRGLANNTCLYRVKLVHRWLVKKFGDGEVDVMQLTPSDIDEFILDFANRWKPGCLGVVRASLRSYLRYRAVLGDSTDALMSEMPIVAELKGDAYRKSLTDEQLSVFLRSFDLSYATGRRDYAIARCLVDLGLRGHEVANLRLDAIDWRQGTITIVSTKGLRVQCLPLPAVTGRALADYLRYGRPQTSNRALFVRHVAPWDKPITVCAIRNAMNQAFARCGLADKFCSTHVLRHTMAVRMQRAGASLKEIADVLRHKDLECASIYARADLKALNSIGLPWPGRQQ